MRWTLPTELTPGRVAPDGSITPRRSIPPDYISRAKAMGKVQDPIFIVVFPLAALMEDQVREAGNLTGLTAMELGGRHPSGTLPGQPVFGSPESWLKDK